VQFDLDALRGLGTTNPEEAAARARDALAAGLDQETALEVVLVLATVAPADGLAWAERLRQGREYDPRALATLAFARFCADDVAAARALIDEAVAAAPDDPLALRVSAAIPGKTIDDEIRLLIKLTATEPGVARHRHDLAFAYYRKAKQILRLGLRAAEEAARGGGPVAPAEYRGLAERLRRLLEAGGFPDPGPPGRGGQGSDLQGARPPVPRVREDEGMTGPERRELLYEGKAKKLYRTSDPALLLVEYKDDATAFNAQKRGSIKGKGAVNNQVTERIYRVLEAAGIETHFVQRISPVEQLVYRVEIVPLETIVRNLVAGTMAKRLGLEEGTPLARPVVEFSYKSDALQDPLINDDHALALGWATEIEIAQLRSRALEINRVLSAFFQERGLRLVDFKLEFGRLPDGTIVLADEISPDTCRLWDLATNEKMDKDRFRRDLGRLEETYQEVLRRVLS
jgi:phosphoribosylaminoimidazole-succinocarboxamide synthase